MISVKKLSFEHLSNKEILEWNSVLENSSDSSIFLTPEWVRLLSDELEANCQVLFAYKNEVPVGIFPYYLKKTKRFFKNSSTSMFETPYGGPVAINEFRDETLKALLKRHEKDVFLLKSTIVLPPGYDPGVFANCNYSVKTHETLQVKLDTSEEELWGNLHKMKVRNIKKAVKNEIIIKELGKDHVSYFYEMLESTYKRLELPPPIHIGFYNKLFELLEPMGRIKLFMAFKGYTAIGSAIFLYYGDTVIYWQGASYAEFMKYAPNDLIHWSVIKGGHLEGLKTYNLLHFHDGEGDEIISLKNYKLSFGAALYTYNYVDKEKKYFTLLKSIKHKA